MTEIPFSSFFEQGAEFQVLYKQLQDKAWVHACLITGEKGLGKKTLALLIAEALLCTGNGRRPCGRCRSCMLSDLRENPDLIVIQQGMPLAPDGRKDRASIPVDDIREMIRLCSRHSVDGNAHVVLLLDAEKMTAQAQNCMLKTLEEPPEDTYIILVTEHPEILLPTVVSRCRTVRMKPWPESTVMRILSEHGETDRKRMNEAVMLADGSIGTALSLIADEGYWKQREEIINQFFQTNSRSEILRTSATWKDRKSEAGRLLGVLESVFRMMMQHRFVPEKNRDISFLPPAWKSFSETASEEKFDRLFETLREAEKQIQSSVNLQAVIEKILFVMMGECSQ